MDRRGRTLGTLVLAGVLALACVGASAQTVIYRTSDDAIVSGIENQGWWRSDGFHQPSNPNYLAGSFFETGYRDFFSFKLTGLPTNVSSATLHLETFDISDPGTLELYDVFVPPSALVTGTNDVTIYQDLGTGTSYGTFALAPSESGGGIDLPLNAAAIADITARSGEWFSIGGVFTKLPRNTFRPSTPTGYAFGYSGGSDGQNRLIIHTSGPTRVPVSGAATTAIGCCLAGLAFLRQRKRVTG